MPVVVSAIPVYNAARFLPETLDCLAAQSRPPDRVVAFDNGSTDDSLRILESHPRLRIEVRRNETNVGIIGNLNRCLSLAPEADYLHVIMADDLVKPPFMEKAIAALQPLPGQALAYVLEERIDALSRVVGPSSPPRRPGGGLIPAGQFLRRQATLETILLPGVLFKTARQPIVPRFGDLPQLADGVFLAECAHHGMAVVEIAETLCQLRLSEANASARYRTHLQYFVRDEWRAMRQIASWIPEPAWRRPLTQALLTVILAARTEVKRQLFERENPDYARQVDAVRREEAGWLLGNAGVLAVRLRDLLRSLRGQPSRINELNAGQGK